MYFNPNWIVPKAGLYVTWMGTNPNLTTEQKHADELMTKQTYYSRILVMSQQKNEKINNGQQFFVWPLQSFVVRSKCGEEKPGPGERSTWPVLHSFLRPLERGGEWIYFIFSKHSVWLWTSGPTHRPSDLEAGKCEGVVTSPDWDHSQHGLLQLLWGQKHNGDCGYLEKSNHARLCLLTFTNIRDRRISLNIPTIDNKFQVFFCRKPCQCVKNEKKLKC